MKTALHPLPPELQPLLDSGALELVSAHDDMDEYVIRPLDHKELVMGGYTPVNTILEINYEHNPALPDDHEDNPDLYRIKEDFGGGSDNDIMFSNDVDEIDDWITTALKEFKA